MTAQMPDKIESKFNGVDFGDLCLYAVIVGDINSNHGWGEPYKFTASATESKKQISSALWNGYISCFILGEHGQLILDRFEYPVASSWDNWVSEIVNEPLKGDFWLVMKKGFYGDRTYIPFVQGKIITQRSKWKIEDRGRNAHSSSDYLEKIFYEINNCTVKLNVDLETAGRIEDFKVYIDGNVNFTYTTKDRPPENGHLIRIPEGKHRIVLREFDQTKPDRKESNTIYFDASGGQTLSFHLVGQNGHLILLKCD